ncbi:MAG: hypothetical protein HYS23_04565 [Geobacter sp.]|nr:hypothetical protein [Geobacter sp.]
MKKLLQIAMCAIAFAFATTGAASAQATKIKSADGDYSVIFPAKAERKMNPPEIVDGEKSGFGVGTTVTYAVEIYSASLDNQTFLTAFTSYTGEGINIVNAEKELQLNRDNFVNGMKGWVTSSTETEYILPSAKKIPGIEFTGETDDRSFHGKFFVSGNDVWGIIYLASKGYESSAVKEQFFDSLKILR